MFRFVVTYFNFLKHIPLLPQVFDNLLRVWVMLTKSELSTWLDEIETEVLSWQNTNVSIHKYGGLQFNYLGKEIGHIHSNDLLDVLFKLKTKGTLMEIGRISHHHVFIKSGWVSFYIKQPDDKSYALQLLRLKYEGLVDFKK